MATSNSKAAANPPSNEGEGAPKKSMKKLWIILIAVLVVVIAAGGAGAWYFLSHNAHSEPSKKKAEPPVFVALDPMFTVNLQPESGEHYLQAGITLQLSSKEEGELFKLHMPQVRSRLLMLLSSKKASDISTTEGKNALAKEILEQVNLPFTPQSAPQSVSNVFFTSFVIQ